MMQFSQKITFSDPLGIPRTRKEMEYAISIGYVIPAFEDGIITVDKLLDYVDVALDWYIPSEYSIDFMNFIRLTLGEEPENSNPKAHYFLIDCIFKQDVVKPYFQVRNIDYDLLKDRVLILATREFSKSSLLGSYLMLYIAAKGVLPGFGTVNYMLYVSDSMRNNVKTTMETIGSVYMESEYLMGLFEEVRTVQDEVNFVRNPSTKKEIALFNEYVNKRGLKPTEVPGRMKRSFSLKGIGASALSLDSVLYTNNGWTTIKDCMIGDSIIGDDGRLTTIIQKSCIFNRPMYEIELSDGRIIKVCEEHINNIYTKQITKKVVDGVLVNDVQFIENNIITSELIKMELYHTVGSLLKKKNLLFMKDCDPLELSEKHLDIDPYTLGILLGDGYHSSDGSIRLEGLQDDVNHYITMTKEKISSLSTINRTRHNKKEQTLLRIDLKDLYIKSDKLGLRGVTGSQKFIPDIYLSGSIEQRLLLLQGLMDTDGQMKKSNSCRFDNISLDLVKGVQYLARSLGGTASKILTYDRSHLGWQTIYSVSIRLNKYNPFSLPRKANQYIVGKNYSSYRAILSIKSINQEPSMCIGVNNASHLFLSGSDRCSFITTHNTGGRGSRKSLFRPNGIFFDDLLGSEADADSEIILQNVESTIESDMLPALSGTKSFAIFAGTPYNKKDPAYRRIEDGSWLPVVFPKAERMDESITKTTFKGVWEDRHTYEKCKKDFIRAKRSADSGNPMPLRKLHQEYYLRISNDQDRLIPESFIQWFSRNDIAEDTWRYNWYITTDYTTTGSKGSNLSGAFLWAVDWSGNFFLVDMTLRKMELETQYNETFVLAGQTAGITRGVEVGIEIDGQQSLHIMALKERMIKRNAYFTIARQKGSAIGSEGIRSKLEGGSKHWRFRMTLPMWQNKKIFFANELYGTPDMNELLEEIKYCSYSSFNSTYDDGLDCISQIAMIDILYPARALDEPVKKVGMNHSRLNEKIWGKKREEISTAYDSYV